MGGGAYISHLRNWPIQVIFDGIRVLGDTKGHMSALVHPLAGNLGCEHLVHTPIIYPTGAVRQRLWWHAPLHLLVL